jgi:hypothetical protein
MKNVIYTIGILLLICSCDLINKMKPAQAVKPSPSLTGSWNLLSLKGIDQAGHTHFPYEKEVKGFATFDTTQKFSLQYYAASRQALSKRDAYYCSDPEIRIAFLSGYSCFGTYRLAGDSLFLQITASMNPSSSWSEEKKYIEIHGDTLLLVSKGIILNGMMLIEHSVWIRSK